MLRLLVLLLMLANGGYFAWSQGLLRPYGFAPAQQSEPARMNQQLNPQAMRILLPEEAKKGDAMAAAAQKPLECLQAGLFDDSETLALRTKLEGSLPKDAWALEAVVEPARWIIYMGKYPNADAVAKKRAELASLNLRFEAVNNPALAFGLSLGGFESQTAADAALAAFSKRGVRTAKVVQERAEVRGTLLRLAAVDDAIKARLDDLKPSLAGKALRACK